RYSERQPHRKLHLARRAYGAADLAEVGALDVVDRVAKRRRVGEVERLPPELQAQALADHEGLHQPEVDVERSVAGEDGAAGIAEPESAVRVARHDEGGRVEPEVG